MNRIISYTQHIVKLLFSHGKKHPKKSVATGIVVACVLVFVIAFMSKTAEAPHELTSLPPVTVASVAMLSSDVEALILLGEVRSVAQAELRAQKSGEIIRVNNYAGQYAYAGTILAEIENASERAMVLSARGVLTGAEASLAKVTAGARTEDRTSASAGVVAATLALTVAEENARSAYSQSYTLATDAILSKTDTFFTNAYTVRPSLRVRSASYDERREIENERVSIGRILETWKDTSLQTIPIETLDDSLRTAQNDLTRIKSFLDIISGFISEQEINSTLTAGTKAIQENTILAARSSIDSARTLVASARQNLAGAISASTIASQTENAIIAGARPEDLQAAQASVMTARGAYNGALATLENTLFRTPISGTITTFNVSRGDYVSPQAVIAVVANPSALEIEAFVSGVARERIHVGMNVLVDGQHDGTVTTVAPGLDPVTKKARLTVGLAEGVTLTNGSFVEIAIIENETENIQHAPMDGYLIPITAIKVLPHNLAVFTVSEENILEAHIIQEGPIVGTKMLVKEGLTGNMQIVTDVRGFAEHDLVEIFVN